MTKKNLWFGISARNQSTSRSWLAGFFVKNAAFWIKIELELVLGLTPSSESDLSRADESGEVGELSDSLIDGMEVPRSNALLISSTGTNSAASSASPTHILHISRVSGCSAFCANLCKALATCVAR
jgi:hypothetical protein